MSCWVVLNGSASNMMELQTSHCFSAIVLFHFSQSKAPNGLRYASSGVLVGGTRQRHFDASSLQLLENAAIPTCQVHLCMTWASCFTVVRDAVLGVLT